MSVLIKTMTELPEHCFDCPCHNGESGYCQAHKDHPYCIDRPSWCPLLQISDETYKNRLHISKEDYKNRVIGVDLNHAEE